MKQHDLLREYVRMLLSSKTNSLVIKGNGGIGKSHSVMDELDKAKLKEGVHFVYVTGHMTPLELFNNIGRSNVLEGPKLMVFDDIDALVTNKISIALLKSALGEVRGKRIVSYHSSSSKVEGAKSINFKGKIILILNDLKQEAAFGKPLLDRCTVFEMAMTQEELIEYVDNILPEIKAPIPLKSRREVWKKIKIFSDNPRFSVRALSRAFEFYNYDKSKWMTMFLSSLKLTEDQKHYYLVNQDPKKTAKQKAEEFAKLSGKSTRAYYRVNQ